MMLMYKFLSPGSALELSSTDESSILFGKTKAGKPVCKRIGNKTHIQNLHLRN